MADARIGSTIKYEDLPGTMAEGTVWSEAPGVASYWVLPKGSQKPVLVVLRTRGSSRMYYRDQ